MTKFFQCGPVLACLLFVGCSGEAVPEGSGAAETTPGVAAQTSAEPQGVIPQSQLDAMAKAAAVGDVLEQAEQERRKKMEAQGL